jgi:toxin ParE1/3/4
MIVEWSPRALDDLDQIADYLLQKDPLAARAIVAQLISAGESLSDFPKRGRRSRLVRHRELKVSALPYFLVYRVARERVIVVQVVHSSRDWPPG